MEKYLKFSIVLLYLRKSKFASPGLKVMERSCTLTIDLAMELDDIGNNVHLYFSTEFQFYAESSTIQEV